MNNYSNPSLNNPSPPSISLTPSNFLQNNQNNPPPPQRNRAGTLPSSFLNSNSHSQQNKTTTTSLSTSTSPLITGHSYNSESLNLPAMDSFSIGVSPSPQSNAIDIPNANSHNKPFNYNNVASSTSSSNIGANGPRRMRSGSLFSTNSIWNDDALLSHSPNQVNGGILESTFENDSNKNNNANGSNSFLSPILSTQNNLSPTNSTNDSNLPNTPTPVSNTPSVTQRNRSYTTTAAIPNPIYNGSYGFLDSNQNNRISGSPFLAASNKSNDMNSLLDNLIVNMNTPTNNNNTNNTNTSNNNNSNASITPESNKNSNSNTPIIPQASIIPKNLNTPITSRNRSQTYSGSTPLLNENNLNPSNLLNSNYLQHQQQHHHQHQQHQPQSNQYLINNQNFNNLSNYQSQQPILHDDFDYNQFIITTNFENPNLGPTKCLLFDNLPQFIDSIKLWSILNNTLGHHRSMGSILSVRVTRTNTSKLSLVECLNIDVAMSLKASFNHLELVPGVILYVAFAKISDLPKSNSTSSAKSIENKSANNGHHHTGSTNMSNLHINGSSPIDTKPLPTDLLSIQESLINSITCLSNSNRRSNDQFIDINKIISIINKSIGYSNDNYQDNFGPLPDPIPLRQFDSPKLRELRKLLENNELLLNGESLSTKRERESDEEYSNSDNEENDLSNKVLTQLELEELCLAMLDELPELCYDYLGNTIVQKLFTVLDSKLIKLMMVKEIAPFLTQLSIHKNGTWAIQKIINLSNDLSKNDEENFQQKYLIGASLKPYAVKLFNDQFGNYVLQGCIKFGSPFNDFIFETMLDNFAEISFGRFGARCIRTILESSNDNNAISNEQVLLVAGLIVEFANDLVINNNGSLLITWFLDTFNGCGATIDDRFELLTNKFLPNLTKLCTHKLANLTILKIINNRSDLRPKQLIMDSIFGKFEDFENDENYSFKPPTKLLENILMENIENTAGPLFIYKIISNPLLLTLQDDNDDPNKNAKYQQFIILQVKRILLEISVNNFQPYKKLMDEVGLSSNRLNRSTSMNNRKNKRNNSKLKNQHQNMMPQNLYNQINYMNLQQAPMNNGILQPNIYGLPPNQQYQTQLPANGTNGFVGGYPVMPQVQAQAQAQAQAHAQAQAQAQTASPQGITGGYDAQVLASQRGMIVPPPPQFQQATSPRREPQQPHPNAYPGVLPMGPVEMAPVQQGDFQQHQQDLAVMQQLEQLSLSSAALGYNSNPGTPAVASSQRNLFF